MVLCSSSSNKSSYTRAPVPVTGRAQLSAFLLNILPFTWLLGKNGRVTPCIMPQANPPVLRLAASSNKTSWPIFCTALHPATLSCCIMYTYPTRPSYFTLGDLQYVALQINFMQAREGDLGLFWLYAKGLGIEINDQAREGVPPTCLTWKQDPTKVFHNSCSTGHIFTPSCPAHET